MSTAVVVKEWSGPGPKPDRKLSTDFIAKKVDGPILPPVIDDVVYFDEPKDQYAPIVESTPKINVYSKAEIQKSGLLAAMKNFQETAKKKQEKKSKKGQADNEFEVSGFQKWTDVVQIMENAQSDYEKRHEGKTMNAIDRFISGVGTSGPVFQAWMDLLPSGEYSSVICGAFGLVIKAVVAFSKVRDAVFNNLAQIPQALQKARDYLEMNNKWQSKELHQCFSRLCASIFIAFEHMLNWLCESRWKHGAKAFFMSDGYEEKMQAKMDDVKAKSEDVRQEAERCSQVLLGNVDDKLTKHIAQFSGMKLTVEGVKSGVDRLSPLLEKIVSEQSKTGEGIAGVEDRLNAIYRFIQDDLMTVLQPKIDQQRRKAIKEKKTKRLTSKDIIRHLSYNADTITTDITHSLDHGRASSTSFQERTKHFMSHPRLKSFLTSTTSSFLLANGNTRNDKLSPMSFSCSMLSTSLTNFGGAIPLSFFCGLHCQSVGNHPEPGAPLLMTSLLTQILARDIWESDELEEPFNFNALFKKDGYSLSDIKERNLPALCSMFVDLVRGLPSDQIVFVLIDGINFYEYGDRREETLYAIGELQKLVNSEQEDLKAVCKVLVTSAAQSLAVGRELELEGTEVLKLNRQIEREDKGFNVRRRMLVDGEEMGERGKVWREASHPDEVDDEEDGKEDGEDSRQSGSEEEFEVEEIEQSDEDSDSGTARYESDSSGG